MMMTRSERESQNPHDEYGSPVRAGPARVEGAWPASGPSGPHTKLKRVISGGETHVCQPSEGDRNFARSMLTCPGS